jgi:hypothetical protein
LALRTHSPCIILWSFRFLYVRFFLESKVLHIYVYIYKWLGYFLVLGLEPNRWKTTWTSLPKSNGFVIQRDTCVLTPPLRRRSVSRWGKKSKHFFFNLHITKKLLLAN